MAPKALEALVAGGWAVAGWAALGWVLAPKKAGEVLAVVQG